MRFDPDLQRGKNPGASPVHVSNALKRTTKEGNMEREDTEGQGRRREEEPEDTEGQGRRREEEPEDTEGQGRRREEEPEGENEVEGHGRR